MRRRVFEKRAHKPDSILMRQSINAAKPVGDKNLENFENL